MYLLQMKSVMTETRMMEMDVVRPVLLKTYTNVITLKTKYLFVQMYAEMGNTMKMLLKSVMTPTM